MGEDSAFLKKSKKDPLKYTKHVDFIKQIHKIYNENYKVIFDKYKDDPNTLMYIDPPYFKSYNSDYMSQNNEVTDMTTILVDLVDLFKSCKCHLIYVHNKNALMDYLFNDFPPIAEYTKIYQTTKKQCIHQIRIK